MVLAQPLAPAIPLASVDTNTTPGEVDVFNMWANNLSHSVGYCTALAITINRAQGAASAGNSYWEKAQMSAAVQLEAQLATVLDQEPALRSNLVAQFQTDGFPAIVASADDFSALQEEISTNGLSGDLLQGLTALGADSQTITNWQNLLLTLDADSAAGSFPQSLSNTNLDSVAKKTAASLRETSLVIINPAILPTGQIRFDVPAEPGYSYAIQFTQDLNDPTSWTALFSTNATTTLLSFTNTPAASAKAGYYRASHSL
jgi:hypothetical protein